MIVHLGIKDNTEDQVTGYTMVANVAFYSFQCIHHMLHDSQIKNCHRCD